MSEKLKQCPFCKGEFAFDFEASNFRCGICGATVPPDPYGRTVNTRPIEDALLTRAEKAEEMVERLIEAVDGYFFGVEHPASIWRKKISDLVTEWKEREENGK